VTSVISLLLAALAALFAWRLSRKARLSQCLCLWLWASAFAALGMGVLLGEGYRLILPLLSSTQSDLLWRISLALLLSANALLLAGVLVAYTTRHACWLGLGAVATKLLVFLYLDGRPGAMNAAVYDGAITALMMLVLCTFGAWTWKRPHGQWLVAGSIVWLFGTVLHQGQVAIAHYASPEDLYGAIMIVVLSLYVRGGWNLRDQTRELSRMAFRPLTWSKR